MNKEQTQEIAMGAALVALAYALWKHFKPGATAKKTLDQFTQLPTVQTPFPYENQGYDQTNPGGFVSIADLLKGVISDKSAGVDSFGYIPTNAEIASSVMGDPAPYGNGVDSVVKVDNGEWWQ